MNAEIEKILSSKISNNEKRELLLNIEKNNPQKLFIKTHICKNCNHMGIEIWVKAKDVTLKEE